MDQTTAVTTFIGELNRLIDAEIEAAAAEARGEGYRRSLAGQRDALVDLFPAAACEAVAERLYEGTGPETSAADRAILTAVIGALRGSRA